MNDENRKRHHRRSYRLRGYDYAQAGMIFVTLCVENRACLFGHIAHGVMELSAAGQIAYDEWCNTPQIRPNIKLGEFVVMPNHVHGIIHIQSRGDVQTQRTPSENTLETNDLRWANAVPLRSPSQTVGAIVRGYKSSVIRKINALYGNGYAGEKPKFKIWQRNYHDRIIRDQQSLQNITQYIKNNPSNWLVDELYGQ